MNPPYKGMPPLVQPARQALLAAFALLSSSLSAAPVRLDIPAQPASTALDTFVRQSNTRVLYVQSELKDVRSNAVSGEHEPSAGLAILLDRTGLTFTEREPNWFVVKNPRTFDKPGSIEGQVRDESGNPVAGARVTLTGSDLSVETDRRGRFVIEAVPAGAQVLAIMAEGMQRTKVTDVTVRPGHRHTLSAITIPAVVAGITQLEDYVVSAKKNDGVIELDPYSVEGRQEKPFATPSIDLTRTEEDVLPFQVYTGKEVEQSGAANLSEFFRNRLTINSSTIITEESFTVGRGLGSAAIGSFNQLNLANGAGTNVLSSRDIVVLKNGRRLPPSYSALSSGDDSGSIGDFRSIPVASIERIEILPASAGAIYGAGANGAVINIITRAGFTGGALAARLEMARGASKPNQAYDFSYSFGHPKLGRLSLSYNYSASHPLELRDRADETVLRYRRLLQARDPGRLLPLEFLGATTNIRSTAGTSLFGPGTAANTSVPGGYAGGSGLAPFLSRQGIYDLSLAEGGAGVYPGLNSLLGLKTETGNLQLGWERQLGRNWRVVVDYTRKRSEMTGRSSNQASQLNVSSLSPFNPFGTTVSVLFYDPRLDRPELVKILNNDSDQWTASLVGGVGAWRALADFSLTKDVNRQRDVQFLLPLNAAGTQVDWSEAVNSGLYNPFVDLRTTPGAADSFYSAYSQSRLQYTSGTSNYQASIKTSGPLFALPAGDIQFTTGVEWLHQERDKMEFQNLRVNSQTGERITETVADRTWMMFDTSSYSLYSELTIPVLSERQRIPLADRLEFFASGRIANQVTNGHRVLSTTTTPLDPVTKVRHSITVSEPVRHETDPHLFVAGMRYDVVQGAALRASRSTGFTPPLLSQITPAEPPTNPQLITDRILGGSYQLPASGYVTGGNPNLEPETSRADNVGVILEVPWTRGTRLSIDYTKSRRDDAITAVSVQGVLDLEPSDPVLAARVQRDSTGRVQFVDARNINFRRIESTLLNYSIEQRLSNVFGGELQLSVAATQTRSLKVQTSATAAPAERVNLRTPGVGVSNWNANALIRWETSTWTLGWSTRYFDDVLLSPEYFAAAAGDRLDWELEHDFLLGYRISARGNGNWTRYFEGLSLSLGVKNVFDRMPRFNPRDTLLGIYAGDSIVGRSFWLQARKSF